MEFLSTVSLDDLSLNDANITFFVSGYIGRSIYRQNKCSDCKRLLIASGEVPQLHTCVPPEHAELFKIADRGGLSMPTEFCFAITTLAVQFYSAVMSNDIIRGNLLSHSNQRSAFLSAVCEVAASSVHKTLLQQTCAAVAKHSPFKVIVQKAFNCFAKNELKRFNAGKTAPDTMVSSRKIRKLTSKASSKK